MQVHLRFFCGPNAVKSEALSRAQKKKPRLDQQKQKQQQGSGEEEEDDDDDVVDLVSGDEDEDDDNDGEDGSGGSGSKGKGKGKRKGKGKEEKNVNGKRPRKEAAAGGRGRGKGKLRGLKAMFAAPGEAKSGWDRGLAGRRGPGSGGLNCEEVARTRKFRLRGYCLLSSIGCLTSMSWHGIRELSLGSLYTAFVACTAFPCR